MTDKKGKGLPSITDNEFTLEEKKIATEAIERFSNMSDAEKNALTRENYLWYMSAMHVIGLPVTAWIRKQYQESSEFKKCFDQGFTNAITAESIRKGDSGLKQQIVQKAQKLLSKEENFSNPTEVPEADPELKKVLSSNITTQRMQPIKK